jgi:hypothetical protein
MERIIHGATLAVLTGNLTVINMKKPNKKNEEKLKLYLSKTNDTKSSSSQNIKPGARPQANQVVQKGARN